MSQPLVDRINFAKIVTILAIIFGVSLGLCGLTYAASDRSDGGFIIVFGLIELAAMALSLLGLIGIILLWVATSIFGNLSLSRNDPQKLFDNSDRSDDSDNKQS